MIPLLNAYCISFCSFVEGQCQLYANYNLFILRVLDVRLKVNRCEAEIDAIRDKIYQETMHMTREEQAKRLIERNQKVAEQYGFKVVKSANG